MQRCYLRFSDKRKNYWNSLSLDLDLFVAIFPESNKNINDMKNNNEGKIIRPRGIVRHLLKKFTIKASFDID